MILYSKPPKATFAMPKKSKPTVQKGQSKSREKQKRRKLNTIRRELLLKNGEVATRKKKTYRASIIPITIILNKTKKRDKKGINTQSRDLPQKKSHFLKKKSTNYLHIIFFRYTFAPSNKKRPHSC